MADIEVVSFPIEPRAHLKTIAVDVSQAPAQYKRTAIQRFLLTLRIGVVIIVSLYLLALLITPYDPNNADFLSRLQPPSLNHWFGTDHLGRDVATRVLYGASWSVGLAFVISTTGALFGICVGLCAGAGPKWLDQWLMRGTDSFFAFPELVAAIAIAGILGPSTVNMVLALTMVSWMRYARLTRTLTQELSQKDFVLQARLAQLPQRLIFWRHYLVNLKLALLVLWSSLWSRTILSISGLSFLGFGVQPPHAEWGAMLVDAKAYMTSAPHLMIFPGIAVLITVLTLNLIGDQLHDHLQGTNEH
jgi:ABC-type dipeptide/oligopeptide/nickel transport system permease subunit